jgi:hypothetical protein
MLESDSREKNIEKEFSVPRKRSVSELQSNLYFTCLPRELALRIVSYLSVKDVCSLSQTCVQWNQLNHADSVTWLHRLLVSFNRPEVVLQGIRNRDNCTWKSLYIQHCCLLLSLSEYQKFGKLLPVSPDYEHDKTDVILKLIVCSYTVVNNF